MKSKKQEPLKFEYNEPRWKAPQHQYPKTDNINLEEYPGIYARQLIEKALQSFEGVNLTKLDELKVTAKDLVKYRSEIKNALYGLVKEEHGFDIRLRAGAIGYLSALKFEESAELVSNIALNPQEDQFVRGYAVEALARLSGSSALEQFHSLAYDSSYNVREKAIRAIGVTGSEKDLEFLNRIAEKDEQTREAISDSISQIKTGKIVGRVRETKGDRKLQTAERPGIVKPIGRHTGVMPQTTTGKKVEDNEVFGGIDLVKHTELKERIQQLPLFPLSYEISDLAQKGVTRLVVRGKGVGQSSNQLLSSRAVRIHEDEIVVDLSNENIPKNGSIIKGEFNGCCERKFHEMTWLPDAPASPVIFGVNVTDGVAWAKDAFSFTVKFYIPAFEKTALLRLDVKMPKSTWITLEFNVTADEIAAGEKTITGFVAEIPGKIEIRSALYSEHGGASKFDTSISALPSNPIWMNVSPSTFSAIGEGPAHYNSQENRFYCYANMEVTNGFSHNVVLGPKVTAVVTDGGAQKDNFSFFIGTTVIPPHSTRTLGVYMTFGGNTYDVFKNFGDVTIRLTLQTTQGDISASHVWAAMAQVKLALNFVGNFSSTTCNQLQSLVDNEASAIYEQQNMYISESGQFFLPSSNGDFNRYRDIRMDDNKDHDCTSGSDEADDLRDDWSSPNDSWLDVWLVETLSGPACSANVGGFSPVDGPRGKGGDNSGVIIKMSSANIGTSGGRNLMALIIAHEVGHFLGLNHNSDNANFMAPSTNGSNSAITHGQYTTVTDHDFVSRFTV